MILQTSSFNNLELLNIAIDFMKNNYDWTVYMLILLIILYIIIKYILI